MQFKNLLTAAAIMASSLGLNAQTEENGNMYLIKDNRVVGKYGVEAVDYVSFKLPEGVVESNLWLNVDNVGKNTVTYTVGAISEAITYAHGIISEWDAEYAALDTEGDSFVNLTDEQQLGILKALLPYSTVYLGIGTHTQTFTDWQSDGYTHIHVTPGTKYYLCAWEVDPVTQEPFDTFVHTDFTTDAPGQSSATLDVSFKRQNEEGLAFNFAASPEILYVTTIFGEREMMEMYMEYFGEEQVFGMFGQSWTIAELQGESEIGGGIEAATWPAWDSGEYVLLVRGYDANGNMAARTVYAEYAATQTQGPVITIGPKSKGNGSVSVNFEISPSNVEEAYVRMMSENAVDDKLNVGYELWEIATGGDASDITANINRDGEYTFRASGLDETWRTIIIYAKDNAGGRTAQRINFNVFEGSNWSIPNPVSYAPARKAPAHMAGKGRRPARNKVK